MFRTAVFQSCSVQMIKNERELYKLQFFYSKFLQWTVISINYMKSESWRSVKSFIKVNHFIEVMIDCTIKYLNANFYFRYLCESKENKKGKLQFCCFESVPQFFHINCLQNKFCCSYFICTSIVSNFPRHTMAGNSRVTLVHCTYSKIGFLLEQQLL